MQVEHYRIEFSVESSNDDPIPSIGIGDSYLLLHLVNDGGAAEDLSSITPSSVTPNGANTMATVTYQVTINNYTIVERTAGFTLARGAGAEALRDADGNAPDIANSARIDGEVGDNGIVATRDDMISPVITVSSPSLTPSNAGRTYEVRFSVESSEPIPTLNSTSSYSLLHLVSSGGVEDLSSITPMVVANSATTMTVTYTVPINNYAIVRRTSGFTLARGAMEETLRDEYGNGPDRANNTRINISSPIDNSVIAIRDETGPVITVDEETLMIESNGGNATYNIRFVLSADTEVPTLNSTSSYVLTRVDVDDNTGVISEEPTNNR